jgi:hypothetical protein
MSQNPTLAEVLRRVLERWGRATHVARPGRVERYDAVTQMADVKPLVQAMDEVEEDEFLAAALPVICNVPVVFPGAGGFRMTLPVQPGDTVLLVFADCSLDRWLAVGGDVDPGDPRAHNLTDAIAIPGLHPFTPGASWTGAGTGSLTLGKDGGAQVAITPGVGPLSQVHLGAEGATEPVLLGTTYRAAEDAMLATLAASLTTAGAALTNAGVEPLLIGAAPKAAASISAAGAALTAAVAALTAFMQPLASATYVSQRVKVAP